MTCCNSSCCAVDRVQPTSALYEDIHLAQSIVMTLYICVMPISNKAFNDLVFLTLILEQMLIILVSLAFDCRLPFPYQLPTPIPNVTTD